MSRDFLRSLLPDFWLMNVPYSESWDRALNRLLDKYRFTGIDQCRAKLGTTTVWIKNIPYAAFTPEIPGKEMDLRASRKTIARALRILKSNPDYKPEASTDYFKDVQ
jgi:hypothetical protein